MKKNSLLFLLGLWVLSVQANTTEVTLENGMKVIVREDHRAPVVTSQLWYRTGGSYEQDGLTGISHLLEHLMFKGTQAYPQGEFSEIIAANGGRENAFTSRDYTAYHQRIASDRLEICLKLEADRMRNLVFTQDGFDKEVQVVMEERRWRVDNKPKAKLFEQFYASAFLNNPVRLPIVGWMTDLESVQLQDVKDWYSRWYAPNNATLVIVGDVKADDAIKLAEKYFAGIKSSEIQPPKPRIEVEQMGVRELTLYGQTASPYVVMGFKAPLLTEQPEKADDIYALEVMSSILDGGNSARITSNLVRGKELAVEAGASFSGFDRTGGIFLLAGTPSKKVTPEALRQALMGEIESLQNTPVSDKELQRVKAQVISSKVFEKDSMFYTGMQIGMLDSVGLDWKLSDQYAERIRAVTAEDIQRVANTYFDNKQLTVATLLPEHQVQ